MVRTRSWLIAAVALGLTVGACKKKEENKAGTGGTEQKVGENPVTKGVGAPAMVAGGDDLSLLPADSDIVAGINLAQVQQSALWKQFGPKLMEKAAGKLAEFKAKCGFDPFEQIKSISFGVKGIDQSGGTQPNVTAVIHGLDKSKAMACLGQMKAEAAKDGTEITVDGDVVSMKDKKGETSFGEFVNGDTAFFVAGPGVTKDTMLAASKGTNGIKNSQTFIEMYSKINTKESLWLLINGNASFMQKAASMGAKPKAVFGSVNLTDGLTVDMRIRFATPDEATQLVNMMKGQINNPQVKQMFDKFDVTNDGSDAKIAIAMSNQKLQQLIGMVGGMMGGMMGGGMGGGGAPTP